jgi:hypothetical protein
MSDRYREAVAFATDFLSKRNYGKQANFYRTEPTEFLYVFGLQIKQHVDEHHLCPSHYSYQESALDYLIIRSDFDKGAFDIVSRIITTKLLRDEPISEPERVFAAQVIGGMRKCPPSEGKRLSEQFSINLHLVFVAKLLVAKYDLTLTRNDESSGKNSACDAVSDAARNLGINKSPRAVKDLLLHKSSKRVREIAEAINAYNVQ